VLRFRLLPRAALLALLTLPATAAPIPQSRDHLNPDSSDLVSAYIQADLVGKYGYLELAYPKAYADDGLGTLRTKPQIQSHSQTVDDDLRAWIATTVPHLERTPASKAILGEIVMVLGGKRLCTRIVPFMDRFLAAGGKPDYDSIMTYVGGLVRLGRPTDALQHYAQAEKRWGMMASSIACQLFGDRFYTAWLIDHNFQDMLDAQREAMLHGVFSGDRNFMQETICEFLRKAAARQELPWFTARMEKSWVWINEVRLKGVIDTYRGAGVEPPAALLTAADPLCKRDAIPGEALRYRAVDALNRGDTEIALKQAERSLELAKPKGLRSEFEALMTVIRVLRQRGELERAYELTDAAQKLAIKSKGPPERGWAIMMKGSMAEKLADYRRALECYAEGLAIGDLIGYSELIQDAKAATARAMARTGDASLVEPTLKRDAELALELRLFTNVPSDYMNWGECLVTLKRYEEAIKAYRQAIAPVKEVGAGYAIDLTCHMNCLKGLGYSLTELKRYDEAEKAYDEYAELAKHGVGSTYDWVWQLGRAKCAWGRKDAAAARTWIERCLDSIDAERASLHDFAHRRSLNENKYEAFDLAIVMALERNDSDGAFRIAERSRARSFLDEMGAHSDGAKVHPPEDLTSLALACPDESVVVFYQLPDRLLAWVVAGARPHLVTMPWTPVSIQNSVEMFSAAIYLQSTILKDKKNPLPGKSDAIVAAKDFYQRIWAPLAEHLPPLQRVCIVPHRALHYVPFQALHDGRSFLIEGREIFYAPSASALVELKRRPAAPASGVTVFDPILTDDPSSPFSKTESAALKKQYPNAGFVLRREATLASFRERAPGSGLIHVSSHGYYDDWMPLWSGLVFAGPKGLGDDLLMAKEIYRLNLDKTELLVMSACVSSVGDFGNGDEVTGITRAFQVAGVRNVIGSLWPVENDATIELMTLFHKALAETHSPATALKRAQCEMISKNATIVKWAPFGLTGLGGELKGTYGK
jgi:CHAT domain-containing protein